MGLRFWVAGLGVLGFGFWVLCLGSEFRVQGLACWVKSFEFELRV